MERFPKTLMAAAFLAAFAIGQEPNPTYQTAQGPIYYQPNPQVLEPTYVAPPPQEPVQQPTEPAPPVQTPDVPSGTQPVDTAAAPAVEPPPLEIIDLSTIPNTGPSIKDWAPTPPGEMNPRTGIVEPNWNNIGTGIPDYSQPAKPDYQGYSAFEEQDDSDARDVHKYPNKEHRKQHWDRHWDSDWKWSPHQWGDW